MYLKVSKAVINAERPSLMSLGTHEMSNIRDVNGEATDASVSDNAIPKKDKHVSIKVILVGNNLVRLLMEDFFLF